MVCVARETPPGCEYFHCLGERQMPSQLACIEGALGWSRPCPTPLFWAGGGHVLWQVCRQSGHFFSPPSLPGWALRGVTSIFRVWGYRVSAGAVEGLSWVSEGTRSGFSSYLSISVCQSAGGIPFPWPKIFRMPKGGINTGAPNWRPQWRWGACPISCLSAWRPFLKPWTNLSLGQGMKKVPKPPSPPKPTSPM